MVRSRTAIRWVAGLVLVASAGVCAMASPPTWMRTFEIDASSHAVERTLMVDKTCQHYAGISFRPLDGEAETLRRVFGTQLARKLPADIDVTIRDADGNLMFSRRFFEGDIPATISGPPVKFVAFVHLAKGPHTVRVVSNRWPEEASSFQTEFFLMRDPKTMCGKRRPVPASSPGISSN